MHSAKHDREKPFTKLHATQAWSFTYISLVRMVFLSGKAPNLPVVLRANWCYNFTCGQIGPQKEVSIYVPYSDARPD